MLKYPALQAALRAGDSMRMEFSWNWSAGCVSNDPSSPAGFGVGTGKAEPFGYTSTSRGNPAYRNRSVISVQGCNRMPALAGSTTGQHFSISAQKWGEASLHFAAGWKGGLVSGWGARDMICPHLWARNAKVTPTTLVSGVFKRMQGMWRQIPWRKGMQKLNLLSPYQMKDWVT